MRILMIAPTYFFSDRGCHIRIYEEAKFLGLAGYQVKIVTYHLGKNVAGLNVERIINFFWYKKIDPGFSWHKLYLDFFLLIKSFLVALKFRPDVFHCHPHEGALIGIILNIFFRKKVVLDSQGSLVDELIAHDAIKLGSFAYKIFLIIEKFIYKFSDAIIVSNKINYNILISKFKIPEQKLSSVVDGIDIDIVEKADKKTIEAFQERYGLTGNKKVIVYAGTLNKLEGIENLLELIRYLKKIRGDFKLLLMGYPNVEYYKNLIEKMNLQDCIKVIGRIDYFSLFNYLALGNFAISLKLPTTEGNLKILNYAVQGLPIICYNNETNRSLIGDKALYLEYCVSVKENARIVSEYLDRDPIQLYQMIEKLKRFVYEEYSWVNLIRQIIKTYQNGIFKKLP